MLNHMRNFFGGEIPILLVKFSELWKR